MPATVICIYSLSCRPCYTFRGISFTKNDVELSCGAGRKLERTVKEAASEDSSSAIRQAYLAALQQELSSLYQLMAQLDALAGHPLPAGMPCPDSHGRLLEGR